MLHRRLCFADEWRGHTHKTNQTNETKKNPLKWRYDAKIERKWRWHKKESLLLYMFSVCLHFTSRSVHNTQKCSFLFVFVLPSVSTHYFLYRFFFSCYLPKYSLLCIWLTCTKKLINDYDGFTIIIIILCRASVDVLQTHQNDLRSETREHERERKRDLVQTIAGCGCLGMLSYQHLKENSFWRWIVFESFIVFVWEISRNQNILVFCCNSGSKHKMHKRREGILFWYDLSIYKVNRTVKMIFFLLALFFQWK